MKVSKIIPVILQLLACLTTAHVCSAYEYLNGSPEELTPSAARNFRAAAKFHYGRANDAQNKMLNADTNDDIDDYVLWRNTMRKEDLKMWKNIHKYEELRDYLEAMIWDNGEIKGFQKTYEKSTAASIVDHLLGKATP